VQSLFKYTFLLFIASILAVFAFGVDFQQGKVVAAEKSTPLPPDSGFFSTLSPTAKNLAKLSHYQISKFNSLANAITSIGSVEAVLVIDSEQFVQGQLSFPANINLQFLQNGRFNIGPGASVRIKGAVSARLQQIFAGTGPVSFVDGASQQVYPQWWGAKGDSRSDDTIPVQAAINAMAQRGGGEVIIPGGIYQVGSLVLDSNISLTGSGETSILEQKKGAQYCCSINPLNGGTPRSTDNKRNIRIANIQFRGTVKSDGFAEHYHLLNINAATDVVVSGCKFTGWRGDGIYIGSSNVAKTERHNLDITVKNCLFDGVNNDNRNAISVIDCDGLTIDHNSFIRCTRANMPGAIDMEPNEDRFSVIRNIRITNNDFAEIGGNVGIISLILPVGQKKLITPTGKILIDNNSLSSASGGRRANGITLKHNQNPDDATVANEITITKNRIQKTARPFVMVGVKGVSIRDNLFEDAQLTGLVSYKDEFKCQDITFLGNVFKELGNTDGIGIAVFNADRIGFTGNTFENIGLPGGMYGIALDFHNGSVDWIRIENNQFKGKRTTIAVHKEAKNVSYPEHTTIRGNVYENSYRVNLPAHQ